MALSAPPLFAGLLLSRNEDDSQSDHDKGSNLFPTVECASQPSKERLAAIKSLSVVADVVEEVSPAVVSITTTG